MRKFLKIVTFVLALLLSVHFLSAVVVAQETDEQKLQRLTEEISTYEKELQRLQSEADTLSNVIAQFNTQIKLTQLKISQTEEKILLLGGRIDQLKESLDVLNEAYNERVTKTYKMSRFSEGYLLFISSANINDAINSFSYLKKLQEADIGLLQRLEKAQNLYPEEKGKSGRSAITTG